MFRTAIRTANIMPNLPYLFLSSSAPTVTLAPRLIAHFDKDEQNQTLTGTTITYRDLSSITVAKKTELERSPSTTGHTTHFLTTTTLPDAASLTTDSPLKDILPTIISPTDTANKVKVSRTPHPVTFKVEDYIQMSAFTYFLEHGSLLPLENCPKGVTDEEYLGGIMSFANADLQRYVVGRAIERDTESIVAVQSLVSRLFEIFAEFDFRNGPIRRKFDGIKYCVRKVENVLYELSVTSRSDEPPAKRTKTAGDDNLQINEKEIFVLKERMEKYDATREDVIKRTREIQKAAKVRATSERRKLPEKQVLSGAFTVLWGAAQKALFADEIGSNRAAQTAPHATQYSLSP